MDTTVWNGVYSGLTLCDACGEKTAHWACKTCSEQYCNQCVQDHIGGNEDVQRLDVKPPATHLYKVRITFKFAGKRIETEVTVPGLGFEALDYQDMAWRVLYAKCDQSWVLTRQSTGSWIENLEVWSVARHSPAIVVNFASVTDAD